VQAAGGGACLKISELNPLGEAGGKDDFEFFFGGKFN
jgi:hypothetical protein|tara:strand:- start:130 stop:240 length:111 start_codon:yes stop_codon:yes gene_type:complete